MTKLVVDSCIMKMYDRADDERYKELFKWLRETGGLVVGQKLLAEYYGSQRMGELPVLISQLTKEGRLQKIKNKELGGFKKDSNFNYTCNREDQCHARVVFMSARKKLISRDNAFVSDVNDFPVIDGVDPEAIKVPDPAFYK